MYQSKYVKQTLDRFGMSISNPVRNPIIAGSKLSKECGGVVIDSTLYKQLVGILMYLTVTRQDLM